jgi:hypothetical protein
MSRIHDLTSPVEIRREDFERNLQQMPGGEKKRQFARDIRRIFGRAYKIRFDFFNSSVPRQTYFYDRRR